MKTILAFYLFSTTALSVGAFAGKNEFSGAENELRISASITKKSYDFQKDPITFADFVQKIAAPEVYGLEHESNSHNQKVTLLKEKIIECHEHKIRDLSTLKQQLNLTEEIAFQALSLKEDSTSALFLPGLQALEAHAESRKKYLSFLAQREEQINTSQGRWDLVFKFLERRVGFPAMGSGNVLRGTDQLDEKLGIDTIPIPHLTINEEAFREWQRQASMNDMIPSFLFWLESQKRDESRDELLLRAWRKNNLPNIQLVYDTLKKDKNHEQYEQILKENGKKLLPYASQSPKKIWEDSSQAEFEQEEPTPWKDFLYQLTYSDQILFSAIHNTPIFQTPGTSKIQEKRNLINSLLSRWSVARKLEILGLPIDLVIGEEDYRLNEEEFYELNEAIKTPHYLPEWVRDKKSPLRIIPKSLPITKLKGGEFIVKDGLLSSIHQTSSPVNGYGLYIIDKQKKFRAIMGRYRDFDQRSLQLIHTDLIEGCGPVLAAGMINVRDGKITYLSDESGHYKPRLAHLKQAIALLKDAIAPYATIKHFCIASRDQINAALGGMPEYMKTKNVSDLEMFESTWRKREEAISFPPSLDYLQPIPGESYEWGTPKAPGATYGTRSFQFDSLRTLTGGKPEEWEPLQKEFASIRTKNVLKIKAEARKTFKKRIVEALKISKGPNKEEEASRTFRTTGANTSAKNKPLAVAPAGPSPSYQHDMTAFRRLIPTPLRRASFNPSEGAVITENDGIITVRTDNKGLHKYQLESERIPVKPGDRLKISYNITSSEDGIVLGLLSTHRAYWLPESKVALKQGNQQGTVEVKIPGGESAPYFVFYNNQKNTRSTEVTINSLGVELLPSVPLRKASFNPPEAAVITEESGIITVRTDNKGLHKYQLESKRIPVESGDRLKISYNITSSEDGIVLGLLSTHRAYWLPESKVALKQGNQQGIVEVKVPGGESAPYLVFYNNQTSTRSTEVTINSLSIEKEEK